VNDDFRDPIDAAIAHDLNTLAPDDLDADTALGALRPALSRARARRRLAVTGAAFCAVVVVLGLAGLLGGGRTSHVNVQQRSPTLPITATTPSTPTTLQPSTSTGQPVPASSTPAPSLTTPTSPATEHGGGPATAGPGSTTRPPVTPPPATHTYRSAGGSVTVTFAHGTLTLDSYPPAAGYQAEVHTNDPSDVEVRFANGTTEWRIRVRVENGRLQPAEITNN